MKFKLKLDDGTGYSEKDFSDMCKILQGYNVSIRPFLKFFDEAVLGQVLRLKDFGAITRTE